MCFMRGTHLAGTRPVDVDDDEDLLGHGEGPDNLALVLVLVHCWCGCSIVGPHGLVRHANDYSAHTTKVSRADKKRVD